VGTYARTAVFAVVSSTCLIAFANACSDEPSAAAPASLVDGGSDDARVDGVGQGTPDAAPREKRMVFVSTGKVLGSKLGGIAGADAVCASSAALSRHASITGKKYVAWLSAGGVSPSTRFKRDAAFVRSDGAVVAADWTALTSGNLSAGMIYDADGNAIVNPELGNVWTGTKPDGTPATENCGSFTGPGFGTAGNALEYDAKWTEAKSGACAFDEMRVYCFEE
jgi:hypothetical protein